MVKYRDAEGGSEVGHAGQGFVCSPALNPQLLPAFLMLGEGCQDADQSLGWEPVAVGLNERPRAGQRGWSSRTMGQGAAADALRLT